jgi:hypothetical protein
MSSNTDALSRVLEDVAKAETRFEGFLEEQLVAFREAQKMRDSKGLPVLAFCGLGRSGKDLAAEWFGSNFDVRYVGSISKAICPLIAFVKGQSEDKAFSERHDDRMYWFEFCNELRRNDPTLLVKLTLVENDVVAGVRSAIELERCVEAGIIDLSIWVNNPRVDPDPTVEFEESDCDITIVNDSTKTAYFRKLRRLADSSAMPF